MCAENMAAGGDLPDSLAASATPDEIDNECQSLADVQRLVDYVRKFSNNADTLTKAQVHPRVIVAHRYCARVLR